MLCLAIFVFSTDLSAQLKCIKGNCLSGEGTAVFPSGARYVGQFREGRPNGLGVLYFSDGSKYVGHWKNQHREGKGRMVLANGDEYLGAFRRNRFHGKGLMRFANGDRYEGEWVDNLPNGKGTYHFGDGRRYEGEMLDGLFEGRGNLFYPDKSLYEGQWENGRRHGKGTLSIPGFDTLSGNWKEDQFADFPKLNIPEFTRTEALRDCRELTCEQGIGRYEYSDGALYRGEFHKGLPHGLAEVTYPDGKRYRGSWHEHAPYGLGTMYHPDGKVVGAVWEYGKIRQELYRRTYVQREGEEQDRKEVRIWAVLVGAASYLHLPTLRYTDDDAYRIYAFLKSPEGGALPEHQLHLLIDERATRANIIGAMENLYQQADSNDVILFYFSGHGLPGSFLPVDFDGQSNQLSHEEVRLLLEESPARHRLVLADACHSGSLLALKTPVDARLEKYYAAFDLAESSFALLMSSRGEEYSLEDGGLRSGIFSHFLVEGLGGPADYDHDHIITISEIYRYVHYKVRDYTGNAQTPILKGDFDPLLPIGLRR